MTLTQSTVITNNRYFPSRIALLAAAELVFIALLLRWSNSPAFFAAAIACSLCSIQLGVLLINRFKVNTRKIRKLARAAEFSSHAVIITDPLGRIKWTNPRFTRLTGFYLSEIAGRTYGMVLHGQETAIQAVENIRRHMRLEQPFEVEILEYNRAGESLWVSSKGEPVHDTRGNLTHYLITQTDISDQRRLIEELAKASAIETSNASGRVADLTRKLESLSASDDREQLQSLVNGLKGGMEQCVEALPPMAVEKVKDHSTNQQNEG